MSFLLSRRGVLMATTALVDPGDPGDPVSDWVEVYDISGISPDTPVANTEHSRAMRIMPPLSLMRRSRGKIRLTLEAPAGADTDIASVLISLVSTFSEGVRQGADTVLVTVGGESSFTIAAGATVLSDEMDFTWTDGNDLAVVIRYPASGQRRLVSVSNQRTWVSSVSADPGDGEFTFSAATSYEVPTLVKVEVGGDFVGPAWTWDRVSLSPWRDGDSGTTWGAYTTRNIMEGSDLRPPVGPANACRVALSAPTADQSLVRNATLYLGPPTADPHGIGPTAAPVLVAGAGGFNLTTLVYSDPIRLHYPNGGAVRAAYDQWTIDTTSLARFFNMGNSVGGWAHHDRAGDPTLTSLTGAARHTFAAIEFMDVDEVSVGINPYWANLSFISLSGNRRTATTIGAGTDVRRWVPVARFMGYPEEDAVAKYYWEVECSGGSGDANGYAGVATLQQLTGSSGPRTNNNPISDGSIGWRGNGSIWQDSAPIESTGVPTYGTGDILMFQYEPVTRQIWFGLNGDWISVTPIDQPSQVLVGGSGLVCPTMQGRANGEIRTIRSTEAQCAYALPEGATYLGGFAYPPEDLRIRAQTVFDIVGRSPVGASYPAQTTYAIVGRSPEGISLSAQTVFTILEP